MTNRQDDRLMLMEPQQQQQQQQQSINDSEWCWLTYLSALSASLGGLLFGYDMGIISGAKDQLRSELMLKCLDIEMIVTALPMGALISSLFVGGLVDKIGRRNSIVANAILFTIGGVLAALAENLTALIIGRLILGFSIALSVTAECVYLSEISSPNARGALVTLNELAITWGVLLAFLVNYILAEVEHGWRLMFGISCIFSLVQGLSMLLMPQTPHYLVLKGREDLARSNMVRFKMTSDPEKTLESIKQSIKESNDSSLYSKLLLNEDNMRPRFVVALGLVLLQQLTGQPNIIYYAADIFKQVGFCTQWQSTLATVGLGIVKMAMTIVALNSVDKIGRKFSLFIGIALMFVCLVILAIFAFGQGQGIVGKPCQDSLPYDLLNTFNNNTSNNDDCKSSSWASWLAFGALMTYVGAFSLGFGPVTWLILSELFPTSIKGNAMATASSFNWLGNVLVSQTFLQSIDLLTLGGVFSLYALLCLLALLFVAMLVPETRNRTLEDISHDLRSRKFTFRCIGELRSLLRRSRGDYGACNTS